MGFGPFHWPKVHFSCLATSSDDSTERTIISTIQFNDIFSNYTIDEDIIPSISHLSETSVQSTNFLSLSVYDLIIWLLQHVEIILILKSFFLNCEFELTKRMIINIILSRTSMHFFNSPSSRGHDTDSFIIE